MLGFVAVIGTIIAGYALADGLFLSHWIEGEVLAGFGALFRDFGWLCLGATTGYWLSDDNPFADIHHEARDIEELRRRR